MARQAVIVALCALLLVQGAHSPHRPLRSLPEAAAALGRPQAPMLAETAPGRAARFRGGRRPPAARHRQRPLCVITSNRHYARPNPCRHHRHPVAEHAGCP